MSNMKLRFRCLDEDRGNSSLWEVLCACSVWRRIYVPWMPVTVWMKMAAIRTSTPITDGGLHQLRPTSPRKYFALQDHFFRPLTKSWCGGESSNWENKTVAARHERRIRKEGLHRDMKTVNVWLRFMAVGARPARHLRKEQRWRIRKSTCPDMFNPIPVGREPWEIVPVEKIKRWDARDDEQRNVQLFRDHTRKHWMNLVVEIDTSLKAHLVTDSCAMQTQRHANGSNVVVWKWW